MKHSITIMLLVWLGLTTSVFANDNFDDVFNDFMEDEGPAPPPAASIDHFLYVLMTLGLATVFIKNFKTRNKILQSNLITKSVIFCVMISISNDVHAQIINKGILSIKNNSPIYFENQDFHFDTNSQVVTTKTLLNYGKLVFGNNASYIAVNPSFYIDGYASVQNTSFVVLPVGQVSDPKHVGILSTSLNPVDVAYFDTTLPNTLPSFNNTLENTLSGKSNSDVWNIQGNNTSVISLSWIASSAITDFATNLSDLSIAGYDGTKWVEILSEVDPISILGTSSNMISGSITTTNAIDVSVFKYFTLASRVECAPLVDYSGLTKIWNGTWNPSPPTIYDVAHITTPYSAGSFKCYSLLMESNVVLNDGEYIEIAANVIGPGTILMSSEANLVQRYPLGNVPNIVLKKKTRTNMRRFDYVYWGTPIAGNFFTQLSLAQANNTLLENAFDLKYKFQSGAGGGWQNLTQTETGKGYIMRVKGQAPFVDAITTDFIELSFAGIANNGNISVPITNNLSFPNGATSHVLLANPYPSAIDADKFLEENLDIDGVVYIWTGGSVNDGSGQLYAQADYIAYTRAGAVVPNDVTTTFNGKIASGQGFKVKSLVNDGNVLFTNCMRLTTNNDQFFRTNQTLATNESPRNRFKLNMVGENAVFSQILIAYMPEATLGYDRLYDAGRNSVSTAQLYSIFEGDGRRLSINARPDFFETDIVPLGLTKNNTNEEVFTISLLEKEGIFTTDEVNIYLHDTLLDVYFDLASGPYTFTTAPTNTTNNRFKIVYQNDVLSIDEFENIQMDVFLENQEFSAVASQNMQQIKIYDLMGREIFTSAINNEKQFKSSFQHPQAVYIAKIRMENNQIVTLKLINKN